MDAIPDSSAVMGISGTGRRLRLQSKIRDAFGQSAVDVMAAQSHEDLMARLVDEAAKYGQPQPWTWSAAYYHYRKDEAHFEAMCKSPLGRIRVASRADHDSPRRNLGQVCGGSR